MAGNAGGVKAPERTRPLPQAAVLGAIALGSGLLILVRWALQVDFLNPLLGNTVLMMPWTAAGFTLLGGSLWIQARACGRPLGPIAAELMVARACALLAIAIAAVSTIEHLTGWNPGFDLLLFKEVVLQRSTVAPGRMSPVATAVQPLLALSLLMMSWPMRSALAAMPAMVAIVVGLTSVSGYLYDAETLFSVAGYPALSLPVALLFLVVGAGALALRPDQPILAPFIGPQTGGAMGRRLLPAAIALPMVLGWIRLQLQFAGWYGSRVGFAIYTCSNIIAFAGLVWWTARLLNRLDRQREEVEVRGRTSLEESELRYRTLAESLPQLVWTCQPDGSVDYLSPQWVTYTGIPADEQLGSRWADQVNPDDFPTVAAQWQWSVISGEPFDVEFRLRRHDGVYRWFRTMALPVLDASGNVIKWFGSNTDIDDRKRAEAELQELTVALEQRVEERTAELKAAKELAESADRMKTDFITTMSHELRTPLNSIIGFTGTMLSGMPGPINAAQDQQLRIIQASGRNLLLLINDVLDVARIESGSIDYTEADVDVLQLLRNAAAEQSPLAESKGLSVRTSLEISSLVLRTDERALRQIITNLVNNAIKFTQHGAITISAKKATVRGVARYEIAVCDTGIGIAPADIAKLFLKFSRLHEALQSVAGGTGLGLYLCRLLASRLGMTIEVDSELGKGTCFTVCILAEPVQRASQ